MSNQDKDYGNILCQAIDTIVTERLLGLEYDQTILCTVVDDTERDKGKYIVSNGSVKFDVVSEITTYRNNNNVYVLIPKGDWNETKTITGKKDNKNQKESYVYRNPFDYLVNITQNIIKENISQGLVANNEDTQFITIWSQDVEGEKFSGYTRLGLQAQFRSWLNPFYVTIDDEQGNKISESSRITSGSYGLRLKITAQGDKTAEETLGEKDYYLYLDSSNMNGNPYEFSTYFQQEQVFDISNFEHITGLELQFYQEAGSFQDIDGNLINDKDFLGNLINPNLFVKDPCIAFGYDTRDFENDEIILYSLNNSTFTSSVEDDINQKKVELRWIHDFGNNILRTVKAEDKENLNYEIRWYKYRLGAQSADKYSGVYWEYINADEDNEFSCTFIPNTSLSEESIKAIIFYNDKIVRSNIVKFTNEKEVINQATIDAMTAVGINCEDGTYGNYRLYSLGNSLLNYTEGLKARSFKVMFGGSELTEAERIEWIIPKENTMIVLDSEYLVENNGEYEIDEFNYHIIRNIPKDTQIENEDIQRYRINGYYSQSNNNNIVTCKVLKKGVEYIGTKELTFGSAGTSGTDVTFILDFENGVTALTQNDTEVKIVVAKLYDQENQEVDLSSYNINWKFKTGSGINLISTADSYRVELQLNNVDMKNNYNILQATLTNFGDFDLVAYLPIPVRISLDYKYMAGPTTIVYNSQGYLDSLIQNPYVLYEGTELNPIYQTWALSTTENEKYCPGIRKSDTDGYYRLVPTQIYVQNTNEKVCLYCTHNGSTVWSQPLLIIQNKYPSKLINEWNGELEIDNNNNAIKAARIVAGCKESDNTFSGVMLGDWSGQDAEANITNNTGIYGFNKGSASFGFRDNGTAFIGKAGTGRIEFDGEKSIIQSATYNDGKGMSINLLKGTINAHEFELNVGGTRKNDNTIFISTNSNNYPLQIGSRFYVKWDGTIKAENGEFSGTITADSGQIGAWSIENRESWTSGGALHAGSTYLYPDGSIEAGGNFSVSKTGVLTARDADISGTITADEGEIGGWIIGSSSLYSSQAILETTGNMSLKTLDIYETITVNNSGATKGTRLGSFGYLEGNDGVKDTDCVGFKSNGTNASVVLESGKNTRISASSGIYLESGGQTVVDCQTFGFNTENIYLSSDSSTIETSIGVYGIAPNMIKFTCGNSYNSSQLDFNAYKINFNGEVSGNIYAKLK